MDPEEHTYPYEIALANVLQKDYKKALQILKKVKKYKKINSHVYQMSGNCYSYLGDPKKAIKEYEEGMKKYTMNKHTDAVTYIDFKHENQLCASCGDDGHIYVFNY